jgi:6-phosphogluconolactonase
MPNYELLKFAGADELAASVANAWLDEIAGAHRAGRRHSVAVSGGRIVQNFFAATVAAAQARKITFEDVHFFWADERCVPPTDPESNYRMANELLLKPLQIPADQIHRLRGEDDPQTAAQGAEAELRRIAGGNHGSQPSLDLIFLGMGEDGHVASLFPNSPAKIVDNSVSFLVVENSPKPPPTRISMSYEMIFAAKNLWILISGAGKAPALRASLSSTGHTPLARVLAARPAKIFSDINEF